MFESYLIQLDRKDLAESRKILLFIDQCLAHVKSTKCFSNIKITFHPTAHTTQPPLDLRIICAFKCHYRKLLLQKTVAGYIICSALHSTGLSIVNTHNSQELLC